MSLSTRAAAATSLCFAALILAGSLAYSQPAPSPDPPKTFSLRGRILNPQKAPVAGAIVLVPEQSVSTETNAQGEFILAGLKVGHFHLEAHKHGFLSYVDDAGEYRNDQIDIQITLITVPSEEIVVTATQTERLFAETPVKTEVLTQTTIERKDASNLAGALSLTTGLRIENNCQNCNFTQVRINGMEGKYSQILIDQSPVMTAMTGVYGLEQIPVEMIERIEIVKGAGSALYGGNAVAGVINIITRDPDHNHSEFSLRRESVVGQPSLDLGFHSGLISPSLNTKAFVFAHHTQREAVDLNGDAISEIGRLESASFGGNLYQLFPGIGGRLKLGFFRLHEDRRGGDQLTKPAHQTEITEWIKSDQLCFDSRWDHSLSSNAHYTLSMSYLDARRETYYGSGGDPNAYGHTRNPLFHFSSQFNYQASSHLLSLGFQHRQDTIRDEALGYGRTIAETYAEEGLFLQDEWSFLDGARLLAGLRVNKHSALEHLVVTPRASLLINLSQDFGLRVSVSSGFRAPQVFDEDLHITQVGGEGRLIVNASDLKEERALSFFAGLDFGHQWGDRLFQASLEAFRTRVSNSFVFQETTSLDNARVLERINGSGALVAGISLNAQFITGRGFSFSSGFTFQRPDFGSTRFFRTPDVYGFARLGGPLFGLAEYEVSLDYTGPMDVPHYAGYIESDRLERTSSFWVVNLRLKKAIKLMGSAAALILGLFNALDQYQTDLDLGIFRDSGYVYGPIKPRTVYAGLNMGF